MEIRRVHIAVGESFRPSKPDERSGGRGFSGAAFATYDE